VKLDRRWKTIIAILGGAALCVAAVNVVKRLTRQTYTAPLAPERTRPDAMQARTALFAELQPIRLSNCELERFGEPNDGGYLMCANLLDGVAAAYSYGISGYDGWGCDMSRKLRVRVHQYDCFDPKRPSCAAGGTLFHEECLAARAFVDRKRRPFDTLENQLVRNGDAASRIVVKMDVEGAEWDAFLSAPDSVLERIDQLVVEFHGTAEDRYLAAVRRLKRFFHVAHLHFNNFACWPALEPFPAWAYEVLFVSKRVGMADRPQPADRPHRFDAPNNLRAPDCQTVVPAGPISSCSGSPPAVARVRR
jgi:hypothetical protein